MFRPQDSGRPRTHGYDGRNKRCKPSGLHYRGVNRISAEGKYRRSRCPEANIAETERLNGRLSGSRRQPLVAMTCLAKKGRAPGLYRGKVLRFHGKSIHFPRKNGPEMQEEGSRAGFAGGKCIKNAIKWFTFRIGETGERTTQCSGCSLLALSGGHGRQACIGNKVAIYENCWSRYESFDLCKTL